jgi:predicted ATPase
MSEATAGRATKGSSQSNNEHVLNFKGAGIFGRHEQIAELRQLLNQLCENHPTQVATVIGISGTGKSRVVHAALQEYSQSKHAVFVESKFDQTGKSPRPFSVFVDVMTRLCQNLSDEQRIAVQQIVAEDSSLVHCIPVLEEFAASDNDFENTTEATGFAEETFFNGYRNLIRAIGTEQHPAVVFLDDLQWADDASLELLKHISMDFSSTWLLLVGAYRDNEVQPCDPLHVALEEIEMKRHIHSIKVDNLDVDTVNEWLGAVLEMNTAETRELAEATVQKTMGNIFFSIQFLESFRERGQLTFDSDQNRWTWCIGSVLSSNDVSDNVIDLVIGRLSTLDSESLLFIKVAGLIGATFSPTLVASIVHDVYGVELETKTLENLLRGGLLESDSGGWVKFAHDLIQQGAGLLVDIDEVESRTSLHWKIGKALAKSMDLPPADSVSDEWILFAAADQLNRGAACIFDIFDNEDSILLASLNLQAGEKAKEKFAFSVAAAYAEAGFEYLSGSDAWTNHYYMALNLISLSAEMAYCSGNVQLCSAMTHAILVNARSVDDKLRAYFTRVQMLVTSGKIDEGVLECLEVLRLLGYKMSTQPGIAHVVIALSKTALRLRGKSDDQLLSLPPMTDKVQIVAMRFLSMASSYSAISSNKAMGNVFATTTLKMVDATVQHGLCHHTPVAYALYGCMQHLLGNMTNGCRYSKLGLRVLDETEYRQHTSWATNVAYCWGGLNRIMPAYATLEPFLHANKSGMHYGFVDDAVLSAGVYAQSRIMAGSPLAPLATDLWRYLGVMKDYKQETMYQAFVPLLQYCLNMQVDSHDPTILCGEAMNQEELLKQIETSNNAMALGNFLSVRIELCYHHGDFQNAEQLAREFKMLCKQDETVSLTSCCLLSTFYEGLTCFAQLRTASKKQRKYRSRGRQCIKFFERFKEAFPEWLLLLQAEQLSLNRNVSPSAVTNLYLQAAGCAATNDASNIRALACERLAEFIHAKGGDGLPYMTDSCCYYSEWGASAKVISLQENYAVDNRKVDIDWSTGYSLHSDSRRNDRSLKNDKSVQNAKPAYGGSRRRSSSNISNDSRQNDNSFTKRDARDNLLPTPVL